MPEGAERACDVIQVSDRYVFAALGAEDGGLDGVKDAREYVLWVFDSPRRAAAKGTEACRMLAPTIGEVDGVIPHSCWINLGSGRRPPDGATYPRKFTVSSENGFAHDPLRVFEEAVAIVESEAWDSCVPERRTVDREADDEHRLRGPSMYRQVLKGKFRPLPNPDAIGKDENGIRNQKGRTYVIEHERYKNRPENPNEPYRLR